MLAGDVTVVAGEVFQSLRSFSGGAQEGDPAEGFVSHLPPW